MRLNGPMVRSVQGILEKKEQAFRDKPIVPGVI